MNAVIGRWTTDQSRLEEQDRELHDVIVPMAKAHPGFIAGYWTRDPETGRTHTTIVLDSEESARSFKTTLDARRRQTAQVGITNDFLVVTDVLAAVQL
jgi:hypothetical protein